MDTTPYITRQDIVNFPFPYKLWIVINLEVCDCLRWNRDGTVILLDLVSLEDYLNSTRSIFKIKNRSVFLKHLDEFKFERLNAKPEAEEDLVLQYQNENFQRHRLDLLARIRRHTYQLIGEIPMGKDKSIEDQSGTSEMISNHEKMLAANNRIADRMLGDLCFMFHGGLSNVQTSRLRFQTILKFQNESRLLEEKLKDSNNRSTQQRRVKSELPARSSCGGAASAPDEEDHVIELSADVFENPHDSVLHLDADFRPEYAGYYGNCSKEQITNFFGEYLPMYEDGSMEIKQIIAESSTTNNTNLNSNANIDSKKPSYNSNINNVTGILTSTPMIQNSNININFSSGLEPIFKTEEDQENVNPNYKSVPQFNNNLDNDTEISMDEFIKFKGSSKDSFSFNAKEIKEEIHISDMQQQQVVNESLETVNIMQEQDYQYGDIESTSDSKHFPLMPAAVKMEIEEDTMEKEANFRSFFSHYKASLNLLYDDHH